MAGYNKIILMGNLTRDPELRYTQSGFAVCSFGLAVTRKYKSKEEMKEETCFVDINVWGKMAENCNTYLTKGRSVLVDGRLNYRTWESQDGQKRSKHDVIADNVTFMPANTGNSGRKPAKAQEDDNRCPPDEDSEIPF